MRGNRREPDDDEFTSEQLLNMLGRRYTCFVFIGVQPKSRSAGDLTFCADGQMHECIGLASMASRMLALKSEDE